MSFTKGSEHDHKNGLIKDRTHFEAFRRCVDEGYIDPFTAGVPVPVHPDEKVKRRKWEAPTAGLAFELEGPDPQAVTMAPAPELCSDELKFEMAEVYELALLRDVPFTEFSDCGGKKTPVDQASRRLNQLDYAQTGFPGRPRITNMAGKLRDQNVFRGSSPGVEVGPYLSQFMLIGNNGRCETTKPIDGKITYVAITIDQKVSEATEKLDYMQSKKDWVFVQNGFAPCDSPKGKPFTGKRRFISTPRDLATYVHFDALYEAYLNACLILLDMGAPFDPSFDALSGGGDLQSNTPWGGTSQPRSAGGFALYGGPHVLTLVTEVATRALKAVRFQKFNNHIRLRPEALAGRIACKKEIKECHPDLAHKLHVIAKDMGPVVGVDPAPGMLAAAAELESGIDWVLCGAEALKFEEASFDCVLSQFGMMFFEDRAKSIDEMFRVLKPGGRLAIAVWDSLERNPGYEGIISVLENEVGTSAADALRVPYSLGDSSIVTAEFKAGGFVEVQAETQPGTARFPSSRFMLEADIRSWLPLFDIYLSENKIDEVLVASDPVLSKYCLPSGEAEFPTSAHIITALKPS